MLESEFRKSVIQYAQMRGWLVHYQPDTQANRRRHHSDSSGIPDLTLARNGEVLFIELKAEGKSPTKKQQDWLDAIGNERAGRFRPSDMWKIEAILE